MSGVDLAAVDLDAVVWSRADPSDMLAAIGTAGDQIRDALAVLPEASERCTAALPSRPRAIIIAGMGGSAMAGDVAVALSAHGEVPVQVVRGYVLPTWVDARDVVIAVSCSGGTEEALAIARQAGERSISWAAVCAAASPLADLAAAAEVPHWPIDDGGRAPRANMWSLTVPLLGLLAGFGVPVPLADLAALADALDADGRTWASALTSENAAKQWAHELIDGLPLVWGTTALGACAAYRMMAQLAENADLAALYGEVPEVNHNQVVTFEAGRGAAGLRLHLLRDRDEHPQVAKRAEVSTELARERGIPVTAVEVDHPAPVVRFGRLVHRIDHATVYAAVLRGIDPCDITPITVLKERIAP